MRLTLLRHGVADAAGRCYGRRVDPDLTSEGRAQARAAAARLGRFDRIVSSPARRAVATAEAFAVVAASAAPPIEVDARWAERDFGEWEGRPWGELWASVPEDVLTDPSVYVTFTPPGGEPAAAVVARVGEALAELGAGHGELLVVTHAGPIRAALASALELPLAATFSFAVEPGVAATLTHVGDRWRLDHLGT